MLKKIAIAAALAATATAGSASTVIGGATLIDTAAVISGTVSPTTFLTYVRGGDGLQGTADGTTWSPLPITQAAALATADHLWAQYDPFILMHSSVKLSSVIAIPAMDHGWTPGNTGEFFEPFEFIIYGCPFDGFRECETGHITKVWTRGVDDVGPSKNADDWTTQWDFTHSYNYFVISSGDRLVGGPYSPGEGEIDALAVVPGIPEPETYALFAAGLGVLGFVARRQKRQRA